MKLLRSITEIAEIKSAPKVTIKQKPSFREVLIHEMAKRKEKGNGCKDK